MMPIFISYSDGIIDDAFFLTADLQVKQLGLIPHLGLNAKYPHRDSR